MSPELVSSAKPDTDCRKCRTHLCDILTEGHGVKHQEQVQKGQMPKMFFNNVRKVEEEIS